MGETTTIGLAWLVTLINIDTGDVVHISTVCQWDEDDPPPQPPPPIPGRTLIQEDVEQVLELETGVNPSVNNRGVSQLPTWFWCSNDAPVDVDATLMPYQAAATVEVVEVVWTIEGPDGTATVEADDCGRPPDDLESGAGVAGSWTPNNPGESNISLTATWTGTWTYTYFDPIFGAVNIGTYDLGEFSLPSPPITYDVYEIQTVGVGNY